jgi:hypothetical protein
MLVEVAVVDRELLLELQVMEVARAATVRLFLLLLALPTLVAVAAVEPAPTQILVEPVAQALLLLDMCTHRHHPGLTT